MATTYEGGIAAELTVPSGITIEATVNAGTFTVTLTAGTYRTIFALKSQLQSDLNTQADVTSGIWAIGVDGTATGSTGQTTIAVTNGTFSITWTSTALRDLLGFTANVTTQTSATGVEHARGLWLPDCPLYLDSGDYKSAPRQTDLRQSVTPTGRAFGDVGNVRYRHRGLRYSHVATNKVWEAQALLGNESLERFALDTQWGQGHTWFAPSSRVVIYGPGNNTVGGSIAESWSLANAGDMESIVKRIDEWDGRWRCEFSEITSDGS